MLFAKIVAVIALSGLCCASVGAANKHVVSGTDKVVDGWVSTGGACSFTDKALQSHGAAWADYNRVLIRFDLKSVDASKYGLLKKATLRLNVTEVDNKSGIETAVGASNTQWSTSATFGSSDGKAAWPAASGHSNLDYAMISLGRVAMAINKTGAVEFDVTDIVERWLYQGVQNNGFIVATGPPIFGRPDSGTWTLAFASSESGKDGPQLVVEMEGTPPTPETAKTRALELYPSPLLPPVRDPYAFVWYGAFEKKLWEKFTVSNMVTYSGIGNWLAQRGKLDLTWGEGGTQGWLPTKEAWENYYAGIAAGNLGYCMHEWHMAEAIHSEWAVSAVREATRKHPECYSAFYFQGQESMAKLAAEGGLDLLINEGYTHISKQFPMAGYQIGMDGINQRTDVARKAGAIEKYVIMLGFIAPSDQYHPGHELTPAIVEEMIRELRAYAPEMPGIGFYYCDGEGDFLGGKELAVACDALARKYFVEPAPDVIITEPAFEAKLSTPHVTVRAEATAKGDRKIARYRWFIDNRLVAESAEPKYVWDIRGESVGRHFVTVHAVDSGFNRAAAQVVVNVIRD